MLALLTAYLANRTGSESFLEFSTRHEIEALENMTTTAMLELEDRMNDTADRTLIDKLLEDQQNLTAVERFSQRHQKVAEPAQARFYRDLIPLSKPGAGEQYAFEVDLDTCSGCKACVSACHSLNGLDEGESWRDIGDVTSEIEGNIIKQTVTTACHHCADPACANGCPTLAYEKDADTGIVRHLDDQCMGCRYCELKCPYDVPKYNDALGIVRKCDMCQGRLAEGEAPACVQACPNEAIKIRVVTIDSIHSHSTVSDQILPGTVTSDYTKPATRFLNTNEGVHIDSERDPLPAHGHFPLAWMLVFTQAGAGVILMDWLLRLLNHSPTGWTTLLIGVVLAHLGLGGSILHLGRPLQAWRAFLGWRQSWLSREIIAFGAWSGASMGFLAAVFFKLPNPVILAAGGGAALLGITGIYCSVKVYSDTRRPFWNFKLTAFRFFLTAMSVGLIFSPTPAIAFLPIALLLGYDGLIARGKISDFPKSTMLISGPLSRIMNLRFALGLASMISAFIFPLLAGVLWIGSELAGRSLFFNAVDEPKMPGVN